MARTRIAGLRHAFTFISLALATGFLARPGLTQEPAPDAEQTIVDGRAVVANEVLVKLKDNPVYERYADLEWQTDADQSEAVGGAGTRRIHSPWLETADLLADFQTHPDVEYAEPNYIVSAGVLPNDPQFGNLWGLLNTGQNIGGAGTASADIDAPNAWTTTTGSRTNVVGVIDSGIDYNHPDLAANVWSAPSQFSVTIGGQLITCAAGTHGFNAITKTCNPMDDNNHGTHCSGTIGGVGNNSVGVAGVNWIASMMGIKFLGSSGSGSTADAVNAIEFAIQAKAAFSATGGANVRVLSNSWGGGGFSQALLDEINKANTNDMLFVAAAGNDGRNNNTYATYPANYNAPNIIAVAATDNRDQRASFSNYGATTVDLAAPGVNVLSTTRSNTYSYFSGTSMATPHVSGAAALVLSDCALSTTALRSTLLDTVDFVPALSTITVTGGRLNVARAIQACEGSKVNSVALASDLDTPQRAGTTITFTATPTGGTAPYQYRWWLHNGSSWTALTGWSASNAYAWKPSVANARYVVKVYVRSAWNTSNNSEASESAVFTILALVSKVTVTANRTSPQPANVTTAFTATAAGGVAPYEYKWSVYDGSSWTAATDWTASRTFAWTPTTPAAYSIRALVRGAGNTTSTEAWGGVTFRILPRISSATLTPNFASPQLTNKTVTWRAGASGGTAPYQYKWYLLKGTTWTLVRTWTTAATYAWTPTTGGTYTVKVLVRSSGNPNDAAEATQAVAYTIAAPISRVTMTPNRASPQNRGTMITWTATPTGGTTPQQYRWYVAADGVTWTVAQDWGVTRTFAWTPAAPGIKYAVRVLARSANATATEASATASAYVIR